MGSSDGYSDEKPQRAVSLASFAVSKTEVTQRQWMALMGDNPSSFAACGDDCPVDRVSWDDIQLFVERLNAKTGKPYRLPSEAQWEYAARGEDSTKWSFGDNEADLVTHAWYSSNSGKTTHRVGQRRANAYGLHDMQGNVWEWTLDCWHDSYKNAPSDGSAWATDCTNPSQRVLRGGSWDSAPSDLRVTARAKSSTFNALSGNGFRVARTFFP